MQKTGHRSKAGVRGSKEGYRKGWDDGYHLGMCEAIVRRTPGYASPPKNLRVLYIPQGFESVDRGVIEGLSQTVSALIVGNAETMADQAREHAPDLVLVMNGLHVFPADHLEQVARIRAMGCRTAIWFADDPYFTVETAEIAPHYDWVFTHELSCADWYRSLGCANVHYLPLAASIACYRPAHIEPQYRSDVCFIGTAFPNRALFFDRMAEFLAGLRTVIIGGLWETRLANYSLLQDRIRPGFTSPDECAKYYAGAKIVLNLHRQTEEEKNTANLPGKSINPRTYEIAASGALQLTDIREDLPLYYAPGREIAVYSSPEEAQHKIRYYLNRESERRSMAWNALVRTRKEHTYAHRLDRLLRVVFGEA
ncbi:CgeB family protein [Cohnella algarum]|uniref:CgeB family protein n=1 Tax=Cohnella algarum TaxID=2044859 RepID=UPI0019679D76|nr:glycosyltransferase [Cohnella algarum]MBN2982669.1 glycosyltransferase [Cohnella algarum]